MVLEESKALDRLLSYADRLLQEAEACFLAADMTAAEKAEVFEQIQAFYLEHDYVAFYRCERYGNPEKGLHYQKILDSLREEVHGTDVVCIRAQDVSCFQAAEWSEKEKDYEKAENYYLKELETGRMPQDLVYHQIAEMYHKAGNDEKAAVYLQKALQPDQMWAEEQDGTGGRAYIRADLIRLLMSQNRRKEAESHICDLLRYHEQAIRTKSIQGAACSYDWSYLLFGYYCLYQMETEASARKTFWENCMEAYHGFAAESKTDEAEKTDEIYVPEIPDWMVDFLLEKGSGEGGKASDISARTAAGL